MIRQKFLVDLILWVLFLQHDIKWSEENNLTINGWNSSNLLELLMVLQFNCPCKLWLNQTLIIWCSSFIAVGITCTRKAIVFATIRNKLNTLWYYQKINPVFIEKKLEYHLCIKISLRIVKWQFVIVLILLSSVVYISLCRNSSVLHDKSDNMKRRSTMWSYTKQFEVTLDNVKRHSTIYRKQC